MIPPNLQFGRTNYYTYIPFNEIYIHFTWGLNKTQNNPIQLCALSFQTITILGNPLVTTTIVMSSQWPRSYGLHLPFRYYHRKFIWVLLHTFVNYQQRYTMNIPCPFTRYNGLHFLTEINVSFCLYWNANYHASQAYTQQPKASWPMPALQYKVITSQRVQVNHFISFLFAT